MTDDAEPLVELRFEAEVIHWRGPAPFFFIALPAEDAEAVRDAARSVSYGWGVVPVEATIGEVRFSTSLFPRDGGYLLPLKNVVRRKADIGLDDRIKVEMVIHPPARSSHRR